MSQSAVAVYGQSVSRPEDGVDHGESRLSLWKLLLPVAAMVTLMVVVRLYQARFGFSTGLDASSPEFAKHWYPWLAFNLIFGVGGIVAWCIWLARTRCKICVRQFGVSGAIDPLHERAHLWSFLCILVCIFIWTFGWTVHAELDEAWHQSTLRDTSLTPTHIFIFYLQVPVMVGLAVAAALYGRTRLPGLWGPRKGIALAYVLAAGANFSFVMIGALNEFGHSIWVFEERFGNPLHWPLGVGGLGMLAFIPLLVQALGRVAELEEGLDESSETSRAQPPFVSSRDVKLVNVRA